MPILRRAPDDRVVPDSWGADRSLSRSRPVRRSDIWLRATARRESATSPSPSAMISALGPAAPVGPSGQLGGIDRRSRSRARQAGRTAFIDRDAAHIPAHGEGSRPDGLASAPLHVRVWLTRVLRRRADDPGHPGGNGAGRVAGRDRLRGGLRLGLAGAGLPAARGRDPRHASGPAVVVAGPGPDGENRRGGHRGARPGFRNDRADGTGSPEPRLAAGPDPDLATGETDDSGPAHLRLDPAANAIPKPRRSRARSRKTAKSAAEPAAELRSRHLGPRRSRPVCPVRHHEPGTTPGRGPGPGRGQAVESAAAIRQRIARARGGRADGLRRRPLRPRMRPKPTPRRPRSPRRLRIRQRMYSKRRSRRPRPKRPRPIRRRTLSEPVPTASEVVADTSPPAEEYGIAPSAFGTTAPELRSGREPGPGRPRPDRADLLRARARPVCTADSTPTRRRPVRPPTGRVDGDDGEGRCPPPHPAGPRQRRPRPRRTGPRPRDVPSGSPAGRGPPREARPCGTHAEKTPPAAPSAGPITSGATGGHGRRLLVISH